MKRRSASALIIFCLTLFICCKLNALPEEKNLSVKGAASKAELGEILFHAIKQNDFNLLLNYLPDDNHLEILISKSSDVDKNIYENINALLIKERTKINFDNIIKYGIEEEVNWSSLEMTDIDTKTSNSLKKLNTVFLTMEDQKETLLTFSFDAMEIEERWFLFQGIRKINQTASLGL